MNKSFTQPLCGGLNQSAKKRVFTLLTLFSLFFAISSSLQAQCNSVIASWKNCATSCAIQASSPQFSWYEVFNDDFGRGHTCSTLSGISIARLNGGHFIESSVDSKGAKRVVTSFRFYAYASAGCSGCATFKGEVTIGQGTAGPGGQLQKIQFEIPVGTLTQVTLPLNNAIDVSNLGRIWLRVGPSTIQAQCNSSCTDLYVGNFDLLGCSKNIELICNDGIDNDGAGGADCADANCNSWYAGCGPENTVASCTDNFDNDGDGLVDCDDTECQTSALGVCVEDTAALCGDGKDNDGDGFIDCDDVDCQVAGRGCVENDITLCGDGVDNDGDGFIDCDDVDCQVAGRGCVENNAALCVDGLDNDGDGLTDCDDPDCRALGNTVCPENSSELCRDGIDNDNDGSVDCQDLDCATVDTDGDLIPDCVELATGTNRDDKDSDDDGLSDGEEDLNRNGVVDAGETDPRNVDTDGDGIQDGTERGRTVGLAAGPGALLGTDVSIFVADQDPTTTTNPLDIDTDNDGILDGGATGEDQNNNGKADATETDASLVDTDGDGLQDGTEIGKTIAIPANGAFLGTDVAVFRPDLDPTTTTDPLNKDTDGDSYCDGSATTCGTGQGEDLNNDGREDTAESDPLDFCDPNRLFNASCNQPPVAVSDGAFLPNNKTIYTTQILNNDSDPDGTLVPNTVRISLTQDGAATGATTIAVIDPATGKTVGFLDVNMGTGEVDFTATQSATAPDRFVGTIRYYYTVKDNDGALSNPAAVTLILEDAGNLITLPDAVATDKNTPVDIDVLGNDLSTVGNLLPGTLTIVDDPINGIAIINANGTITYTPDTGYEGFDELLYTITDDQGNVSDPELATIFVNPIDVLLVAVDDATEVINDGDERIIPILLNDIGFGSPIDSSTVVIVDGPSRGTAVITANGRVAYTPTDPSFRGIDVIKYTVRNADGTTSNEATVFLVLTPPIGENTREMCNDGIDNDGDGEVDCADQDCKDMGVTVCPPDLMPTILLSNTAFMQGDTRCYVININEIKGIDTEGEISVFINDMAGFTIDFPAGAKTVNVDDLVVNVDNSAWTRTATTGGMLYKTSEVISGFGKKQLGIILTANTRGTVSNLTTTIIDGSGGEVRTVNNRIVNVQTIQ